MKNLFFSSWAMFYIAFILNININQVSAGDSSPKIRAEKIPLINKMGRAIFGPKELKTPRVDEYVCRDFSLRVRAPRGKCKPDLLVAEVPPPPPLLTAHVPPPYTPPLLTAHVPPVSELLVASVPERVEQELLVASVPERVQPELIVASVPSGEELLLAEVPPPLPPIVNYIRLPCPPDPCQEHLVRAEPVRTRCAVRDTIVEAPPVVVHPQTVVQPQPVVWQQPIVHPQSFFQPGCNQGGFVGGHPQFLGGGNQFVGGHPQDFGGSNYDRAMAWGHHVVDNAYDIGYGIGTNAYDIGRSW